MSGPWASLGNLHLEFHDWLKKMINDIYLFFALVNLPPTLAKSQVSSVRKNMKMHMLSLLKHKASVDYITQITTLLTDLGATNSEVMQKNTPKCCQSLYLFVNQFNMSSKIEEKCHYA